MTRPGRARNDLLARPHPCAAEEGVPFGYRPCGRPAVTVIVPAPKRRDAEILHRCWEHLAELAREEARDRPLSTPVPHPVND